MVFMTNLYAVIDQNISFCKGRLELSSEKKDSSKCINLLWSYTHFTNLEWKFSSYIFFRKIGKNWRKFYVS
jgi:hypothetical protein